MDAAEAWRACTGVTVHAVCAVGTILAGVAVALIDIFLTPEATEARQARAGERVHAVFTEASVTARV